MEEPSKEAESPECQSHWARKDGPCATVLEEVTRRVKPYELEEKEMLVNETTAKEDQSEKAESDSKSQGTQENGPCATILEEVVMRVRPRDLRAKSILVDEAKAMEDRTEKAEGYSQSQWGQEDGPCATVVGEVAMRVKPRELGEKGILADEATAKEDLSEEAKGHSMSQWAQVDGPSATVLEEVAMRVKLRDVKAKRILVDEAKVMADRSEEYDIEQSRWGQEDGPCATVVGEVAMRVTPLELGAMAAVCRAWCRAVDQPHVWRRVLSREHNLTDNRLKAMASVAAELGVRWSWREEATLSAAGWAESGSLQPEKGVVLQHAALTADGMMLAVAAEDASVSVWEWNTESSSWNVCGQLSLRSLGWATAARVEWSPQSSLLLVAGPLALAPRWELAVLELTTPGSEELTLRVRANCGAGGAACWLPNGALLALELRRAGPMMATTVVWLYSAGQETHSEHAGVAAPVLRLYNEGRSHFTHAMVATDEISATAEAEGSSPCPAVVIDIDTEYYRCILDGSATGNKDSDKHRPLLVLAGGSPGGGGGATALSLWLLPLTRPPPLSATEGGDLRSRREAFARRPPPPPEPPPDPPEAELRALCTPPREHTELGARICGLVLHPGGRCMWAALEDGRMVSVSLPALRVLRELGRGRPGRGIGTVGVPYLQPAASTLLIACPLVEGGVRLWCTRSGVECEGPELGGKGREEGSKGVGGMVVTAGLRAGGWRLLLLGGDQLQEWISRASPLGDDSLD